MRPPSTSYVLDAAPQDDARDDARARVRRALPALGLIVGAWFLTVLGLVFVGAFQDAPGGPPTSIIWANVIPVGAFIGLYALSPWARGVARSLDLSLLAGLHALRTIGFSFLVLAGIGQLPWLFAIPAGIGDVMVAIGAPFIALYAAKQGGFPASNRFLAWNIFGVVDFLVAVGAGSASRILGPEVVGAGMEPMATLPLVMIPGFLVPLFMITHIIMLMHALEARKNQGFGHSR